MSGSLWALPLLFITLSLQGEEIHTSVIQTIAGSADDYILGTEFSFGGLAGLATDSFGNTFFTVQALSRVYRLGLDGRVSPYAGNGIRGRQRDGVPAINSPLLNPSSLTVDAAGNLYIVVANALLRIDPNSHVISTVFITPYRPAGTSITIFGVGSMAVGPTGLLYICDGTDSRIKTYSFESGAVRVVAGNGKTGATQSGVATSTPLRYPQTLAVAADGTVYFSTLEPAVYRVNPSSRMIEVIHIQLPQEARQLDDYDNPHAITLDGDGHLFVAQGNRSRVLRINLNSNAVTIYGGTGRQGFNGDWIDARRTNITIPTYLAADSSGNLVVGEEYRIRRIHTSGRVIETIAGNGLPNSDDSGTTALRGRLWEPANVASAPDGSIFVTSSFSQRVMRVDPSGNLTTVAGGGDRYRFLEPGPPLKISLNYPEGLWISESGDVYFSDNDNRIVRHLQPDWIDNFATTPKNSNSYGGFLYYAAALIADNSYFYLSDPNGQRVWRIARSDGSVEAYAGAGPDAQKQAGEDALSQTLVAPSGLAMDTAGNLFIADGVMDGHEGRILRVDAMTGRTSTVLSHLRQPSGLAFQSAKTLCFSESGANQVRCFNLATQSIWPIAGTGVAGYTGDGGPAQCAQLNRPSGITFDKLGRLYIADTGNQRVRVVQFGDRVAACQ
jgi:sugar lactone lactonase YvrE